MGCYVTGIYLLTTEFGLSPVHCDWTNSPVVSKTEMVALTEDNFVRRTDVSSPNFDLIHFYLHLYAFIILTSERTYIKTTAFRHHQFLLLQVNKKTEQACSYQISLDKHNLHSLLYRNTSACHVDV